MTLSSGVVLPHEEIATLCRRYRVKELSVFGSAARGDMRSESDIDIMVEFDPSARVGLLRFVSLGEELEAVLGQKVDLVTKQGLKPWLRPQILREARLVYAE